ncbi:MAG: hypothetical protein WD674_06960 [Cucumibacter sp.]
MRGDLVTLTMRDATEAARAAAIGSTLKGADTPSVDGNIVRLHVPDGASALPSLMRGLNGDGLDAVGVEVASPTLDDVFLTLAGRSLRDETA